MYIPKCQYERFINKVLTTEMRCNGSKPCQGHIKRQHSEKKERQKKECCKILKTSSTDVLLTQQKRQMRPINGYEEEIYHVPL